jgi:hypothetical protein
MIVNKSIKIFAAIIVVIVAVVSAGFLIYVSDYYKADDMAVTVMNGDKSLKFEGNLVIMPSKTPSDTGIIFYPGGKVEHTAYIPLLEKLTKEGINCVLVKMPFNLAVLNPNAADEVLEKLPDIKNWYIGGHSLGGAMASSYISKNKAKVKGLILMGAYIYGNVPASNALTIYGSQDKVLDKSKVNYTENVFVIEGGNHAQYGNYGEQAGDGKAVISREKQQEITTAEILRYITNKGKS